MDNIMENLFAMQVKKSLMLQIRFKNVWVWININNIDFPKGIIKLIFMFKGN